MFFPFMRIVLAAVLLTAVRAQAPAPEWHSLFDGKTLAGWKETPFRNAGRVTVEGGAIVLANGAPLTGVNYVAEFPKLNYEIRFEARKLKGGDFFSSLTFPVDRSYATFVTGGWGGDIIGISSIDGWDASDNETRAYYQFEPGRWYRFRLRVTADRLMVWIDNKRVVNVEIGGRKIGLRPGPAGMSAPFGFASYNTAGAVRNIEYRMLRTAEITGN